MIVRYQEKVMKRSINISWELFTDVDIDDSRHYVIIIVAGRKSEYNNYG